MKKLFAIAVIAIVMIACSNGKKSVEETKTTDSVTAPSQAAAAESIKAEVDSTMNQADSTKK